MEPERTDIYNHKVIRAFDARVLQTLRSLGVPTGDKKQCSRIREITGIQDIDPSRVVALAGTDVDLAYDGLAQASALAYIPPLPPMMDIIREAAIPVPNIEIKCGKLLLDSSASPVASLRTIKIDHHSFLLPPVCEIYILPNESETLIKDYRLFPAMLNEVVKEACAHPTSRETLLAVILEHYYREAASGRAYASDVSGKEGNLLGLESPNRLGVMPFVKREDDDFGPVLSTKVEGRARFGENFEHSTVAGFKVAIQADGELYVEISLPHAA